MIPEEIIQSFNRWQYENGVKLVVLQSSTAVSGGTLVRSEIDFEPLSRQERQQLEQALSAAQQAATPTANVPGQ